MSIEGLIREARLLLEQGPNGDYGIGFRDGLRWFIEALMDDDDLEIDMEEE